MITQTNNMNTMINQPAISTMEGRHAVERASRKFRIQALSIFSSDRSDWKTSPRTPSGDQAILFDWRDFHFRIHPDDLQAWSETQAQKETAKLEAENAELKRQLAAKDGSIKHFLDEIEEYQKDTIDLNAKLDEAADRKPVTAQDWDEKKEPATVTPGPIEDYRPWTNRDVQDGTVLRMLDTDTTADLAYCNPHWCLLNGVQRDYGALLRSRWRQLNGDRCGVRKEGE